MAAQQSYRLEDLRRAVQEFDTMIEHTATAKSAVAGHRGDLAACYQTDAAGPAARFGQALDHWDAQFAKAIASLQSIRDALEHSAATFGTSSGQQQELAAQFADGGDAVDAGMVPGVAVGRISATLNP
jgi:uncharacterized protein YukE